MSAVVPGGGAGFAAELRDAVYLPGGALIQKRVRAGRLETIWSAGPPISKVAIDVETVGVSIPVVIGMVSVIG
jgi:hypothetical protein